MVSYEEFLSRAKAKASSNLSFEKSSHDYRGMKPPIVVKCVEHDLEFTMSPVKVLAGQNSCPDCGGSKRLTTEDFIRRAQKVHQPGHYDYSQTEYVKMLTPVTITCLKHGEVFQQYPQNHLKGSHGCSQCNGQSPITKAEFVERSEALFGEGRFDYSSVDGIVNMHSKVTLRCVEHNEPFSLTINSHLKNQTVSCVYCNKMSPMTEEKFKEIVRRIFPDKEYNYDQIDWTQFNGVKEKYSIGCPELDHGYFLQSIEGHIAGKEGCVKCSRQGPAAREQEVANFIASLGLNVIRNDRKLLNGKELDIYIPEKKITVEFNGIYWHSERFGKGRHSHVEKLKLCAEQGVQLIQIWEDDWQFRREIVQQGLLHRLGESTQKRIAARKTVPRELGTRMAREFLHKNHIQGYATGSMYLGLFEKSHLTEPVAVIVFTIQGGVAYLERYATNAIIQGGFTKLLKFAESILKDRGVVQLVTFADRTLSQGHLYESTGWVVDKILPPDYMYVVDNQRVHKFGYRLKRFRSDPTLQYEEGLTERELAQLNGLERIWDAGKIRYVKNLQSGG